MNNSQSDIRIEISDVTEPQENLAPPQFHSLIRKASYSAVTQDVPVSDSTSNLIDLTQITCPICKKDLTAKDSIPLKKIKPRFLRLLKSNFSCDLSDPNIRVCKKDLNNLLQQKIDSLLTEESTDFSKLQEDSMAFLSKAEIEENHWQDRFKTGRTFGQICSDIMALKIGSWAFVMAMLLILATWASLNVILANVFAESKAWDPYPFTLLNLFLSIIATMQGPIIMMSQNRQGDIERVQNNYIRKIILQGENQTRLVNAKMDYLITSQWRRLLEIQEIQVDLLQILQTQGSKTEKTPPASPDREPTQSAKPSSTPILKSNTNLLVPPKMDVSLIEPVLEKSFPFTVEITPDEHTGFIMRHYLNKPDHQDDLLFSHWTVEEIGNIKLEIEEVTPQISKIKGRGVISVGDVPLNSVVKGISYEISFALSDKVTLDDILSGDSNVYLRNDFDLEYMNMNGKIKRVEIFPVGKPAIKIQNGSFPQRYKPTFSNSSKRFERITEFWSAAIEKVQIFYSVPVQVAIVSVGKDWVLKEIHVEFFKPENRQVEVGLVMKNEPKVVDPLAVVDHISNGFNGDWKRVAHGDFSDLKNVNSDVVVDGMGDLELQGPDNFLFAAINSRVVVRGVFEKVAKVTN